MLARVGNQILGRMKSNRSATCHEKNRHSSGADSRIASLYFRERTLEWPLSRATK